MFDWLNRAAIARPDGIALERDGTQITYAELLARARGARPHAAPGERVPLAFSDRVDFAVALHGCLLDGAAAVPIDLRLSHDEQAVRRRPGVAMTPDTMAIMHTSGTTSAPKPVELTRTNFFANAAGSALALGLDPHERWLAVMPLAHAGGLTILARSTVYASTVVIHDGFDTGAVLAELMDPRRAITLVSLVPTMLARLLDAGLASPPTLRWALLGGGPIPPGLVARAQACGVPVAPTYGMTEACSQIATFGLALHGAELRISADGEVQVRGAIVAPGALGPDGWLATGDLGSLDAAGRLHIIGRRSDTIISGGENVAPAEVEAVLLEHPGVADAGVFARPDDKWGEAVWAAVVAVPGHLQSDSELQELHEFCRGRLAAFKIPKQIRVRSELPRTASGKLLRRALADPAD